MSDIWVLTWGELDAGGFKPHLPSGAPADLREAGYRLLDSGPIGQPPGEVSTLDHPVRSLSYEDFTTHQYWCVTLQGRGGQYGAAGLLQYAFVPAVVPPSVAWRWADETITAAGGWIPEGRYPLPARLSRPPVLPPRAAERLRTPLFNLLTDVSSGRDRIGLTGLEPAELVVLYSAALGVLPDRLVSHYLWATCLLVRPTVRFAVVTAPWPDDFRNDDRRAAERIDQWLSDTTAANSDDVDHALETEQLDWLVAQASSGRDLWQEWVRHGVTTLHELSSVINDHYLDVRMEQVPALLASPDGRRRLAARPGHLALVRHWALDNPEPAIEYLVRSTEAVSAPITQELFCGLLDRTCASPSTANPLRLPGSRGWSGGWPRQVAAAIRAASYPLDELLPVLTGRGGPLGTKAARASADDWLRAAGLEPTSHPELFEPRPQLLADAFLRGEWPDTRGWEELRTAADPRGFAQAVIDATGPSLSPQQFGVLVDHLAAAVDERGPRAIDPGLAELTGCWFAAIREVEPTALLQLLETLDDRVAPVRQLEVARAGLDRMSQLGVPSTAELDRIVIGVVAQASESPGLSRLLLRLSEAIPYESASGNDPAAPGPRPISAQMLVVAGSAIVLLLALVIAVASGMVG